MNIISRLQERQRTADQLYRFATDPRLSESTQEINRVRLMEVNLEIQKLVQEATVGDAENWYAMKEAREVA